MQDHIPEVRHPTRGDVLTPLERELWRFRMVALEVQQTLQGFNSVDDVARQIPDGLMFSLMNHGLILISKFLEIWDDFGRLARDDQRVVRVRRAADPLVNRLLVWEGIEAYRNTTVAHAYTTKNDRLVGPWFLLQQHKAPTFYAETILLLNCVNLATAAVLSAFEAEYIALKPSFGPTGTDPQAGPGIVVGTDMGPETRRLALAVNERLKAEGFRENSPVFAEFRRATHRPPDASNP